MHLKKPQKATAKVNPNACLTLLHVLDRTSNI